MISGRVAIEASGETVECDVGTLVTFDPGERHAVRGLEDARLLLCSRRGRQRVTTRQRKNHTPSTCLQTQPASRSMGHLPTTRRQGKTEDTQRPSHKSRDAEKNRRNRPPLYREDLQFKAPSSTAPELLPHQELAPQGWSVYGAKRAQPVATGCKSDAPENRPNKPIRNGWQPTATVSERMVRRGRRFESARRLCPTANIVAMTDESTTVTLPDADPIAAQLLVAVRSGEVQPVRRLLSENPHLAWARFERRGGTRTALHVVTDWPGYFANGAGHRAGC